MKIKNIKSGTKKNLATGKPNEDYFSILTERNLFVIADGVTRDKENGKYPNPSPSSEVSKIFCHKVIEVYSGTKLNLKKVFVEANKEIKKYNVRYPGYFKPGTVGIAVLIEGNNLSFASIGDCIGIILRNGNLIKFNEKQTEKLRNSAQKFSSEIIRTEICNNILNPFAYGVINGDINANNFIEFGELNLQIGDKVVLMSDGLEMLLELERFEEIMNNPIENIFSLAEDLEKQRNFRTDDKTLIIFELGDNQ